jgi:hypothetical protein
MDATVLIVVLGYGLNLLFVVTVVCLCLWSRQRAPFKSPLWLIAYLLLPGGISLITAPAMRHVVNHYMPLIGWTAGTLLITLSGVSTVADSLAKVLLVILISSDVVFLLTKAGLDTGTKLAERLAVFRQHHILFGTSALSLAMLVPFVIGLLWLRT